MAESKHHIFKTLRFVLDGDCSKKYDGKQNKLPPRTVILPGDVYPERLFYHYVNELSDNDPFWDIDRNFNHQTCFSNFFSIKNYKGWFNDETNKEFFGKGYNKLFNRWKKDNQELVKKFQTDLEKIIF